MKIKFINYFLCMSAIVCSIYLVITRDDKIGLILKDLSVVITITIPYICEKLFKMKIDDKLKLLYISFIFTAHFLGATLELYNKITYFDKITHTLSGVLTAYGALLILYILGKYKIKEKYFNTFFMICFTLSVAAFWEIFEYLANILFGGDAQRVMLTGVNDTMQDIIVAFLGSILVSLVHLFYNNLKIFDFSNSIKKDN